VSTNRSAAALGEAANAAKPKPKRLVFQKRTRAPQNNLANTPDDWIKCMGHSYFVKIDKELSSKVFYNFGVLARPFLKEEIAYWQFNDYSQNLLNFDQIQ
jgi:hypothetical protein